MVLWYSSHGHNHWITSDLSNVVLPPSSRNQMPILMFIFSGTYSPEKQKYPYHKYPPQYSFGSRTRTGKKDQTPGPNTYNLPGILGPKAVGKKSAPSYSLVGRSKIGGFHEDLQKVKDTF